MTKDMNTLIGLIYLYHLAQPQKKAVEIYRQWSTDITLKEYQRPTYITLLQIFKEIK